MVEKFKVNPWEVSGDIDYNKLIREFGIKPLKELPKIFNENILFRRKIVFAHRDIQRIFESIQKKKEFVVMTGLMPTGKMHIGHMILIKQLIFWQSLGAKIYLAVADLEAYNVRKIPLSELREIAINEYLINYIALGLDFEKCDFYFQSNRDNDSKKSNAYYRLASSFSRYATFNEFKGVYGEITPGKMNSSLLQSADMYHAQLPEFEGKPLPVLIPVGIDQDPHLRIARDMANRNKDIKFIPISSTYHLFSPGLKGGKMSASDSSSYISLTDTPEEVRTKINKYAFSGGQPTIEEHREKGGNPDIDVCFQYLKFFFEEDDNKLKQLEDDYREGKLLTSELKKYTIEKINDFLKQHQIKRKEAEKKINKFFVKI